MTSLAAQLKKLAVPQTQTFSQDFKRPSLLFDPKEAISIDRDDIFLLGLNGLEELESLNSCFSQFHATLFSESSIKLERSVHSKEANENLNKEIKTFLLVLSPYVLLKPAHKTLEWLIYRYHIESYNMEEILACILPYHDTNIFVRIVQLFDLKSTSNRWHWLSPIQKPGLPLAKSTLITHCHKDLGFLRFVCNIVSDTLNVVSVKPGTCRAAISFYLTSVIGAMESSKKVSEEFISILLPYIVSGLKSQISDHVAATYMIICQLGRRADLNSQFLADILDQIILHLTPDLMKEAIGCLCVLFQNQNMPLLSLKCLSKIHSFSDEFFSALVNISEQFSISQFLKAFGCALIEDFYSEHQDPTKTQPKLEKLTDFIQHVNLSQSDVVYVTGLFIDKYLHIVDKVSNSAKEKTQAQITPILNQIERRYPSFFDEAIKVFSHINEANSLLLKMSVSPILNVHHSNAVIRKQATNQLVELVKNNDFEDKVTVGEVILSRLNDDDFEVVKVVLDLQEKLLNVVDETVLVDVLSKLVLRDVQSVEWDQVIYQAVKLLCHLLMIVSREELVAKIFITLLPFMYYKSKKNIEYFSLFNSLPGNDKFSILKIFSKDFNKALNRFDGSEDNIGAINLKSLQAIHEWAKKCPYLFKEAVLKVMVSESYYEPFPALKFIQNFMILGFVSNLSYDKNYLNCLKLSKLAFDVLLSLAQFKVKSHDLEFELTEILLSTFHSKFEKQSSLPYELFCVSFDGIIQYLKVPDYLKDQSWWNIDTCSDETSIVYMKLLLTLLSEISNSHFKKSIAHKFKDFITEYFKILFSDHQDLLKLLSMVWCKCCISAKYVLEKPNENEFNYVKTFFLNMLANKDNVSSALKSSCVVPTLLIGVANKNDSVRKMSLDCLTEIAKDISDTKSSYLDLILFLTSHKEELINDQTCMPQMIREFYLSRTKSGVEEDSINCILKIVNEEDIGVDLKTILLSCVSDIDSHVIFSATKNKLQSFIDSAVNGAKLSQDELELTIKFIECCFKPETASHLTSSSCNEFKILKKCLNASNAENDLNPIKNSLLKTLNKKFFSCIPKTEAQQALFCELLNLYVKMDTSDIGYTITHCLKKLPIDAALYVAELSKYSGGNSPAKKFSDTRKPKRSVANLPIAEGGAKFDVDGEKKLILILETIQKKKKMANASKLLPALFSLLQKCLNVQTDNIDYIKQLHLSCINHTFGLLEQSLSTINLTEEQFSIELVIECMRSSKSTQMQHEALILLTQAAVKFPDYVLHSVMTVFTFMGENIVKIDDKYSFQVIVNTVGTIVPIIIQNCKESESYAKIVSVFQVFIDALPDIPNHRRLPLFKKLLSTVEPSESYLHVILVLLFGHIVDKHEKSTVPVGTDDSINVSREKDSENLYRQMLTEFALDLCLKFSTSCQLTTCESLILYLLSLPEQKQHQKSPKKSKARKKGFELLFNSDNHTDKQLRHLKFQVVSFVTQLLTNKAFVAQVVDTEEDLKEIYGKLIETTMFLIKSVTNSVTNYHSNPSAKFWKVFLHKIYDILDKINSLLPCDMFVSVISKLISSETTSVRRKAMEILNSKLQHQPHFFNNSDEGDLLLGMIPSILDVISTECNNSDASYNQQTGLYSLKLLIRTVGHKDKKLFAEVAVSVIDVLLNKNSPSNVQASALLCIADLVSCLGPHMIVYLPKITPFVVNVSSNSLPSSESILLSALIAIQKLLEHLSNFLSPYLQAITTNVVILSAKYCSDQEIAKHTKSHHCIRLQAIQTLIPSVISPRVLLPIIEECYQQLAVDNKVGIRYLMVILSERIKTMDKNQVGDNFALLEKLYLTAFKFRAENTKETLNEVVQIEGYVIQSFTSLILKLSETSFRPLFFKLFNWATQEEDRKEEVITFYRLTDRIADTLKGLFVLFAGNIVKHASKVLEENFVQSEESDIDVNDDTLKTQMLLSYILDTLKKCFLYDHEGFINKERFETLLRPLTCQLENFLGGDDVFDDRIRNNVCPCIAQFAVASGDELSWKQLNYQVLLKTRHSSPKVRQAALLCTLDVCKKLGDEFNSLLPETIPFLAELMEDESLDVEKQCQEVISEMEAVLGESLQSYF